MQGMQNLPKQLPDDIESLKALVAEQAAQNEQLSAKILSLQEQLNLALARRYAASSEKISPDQIHLFDEAEQDADPALVNDELAGEVPIPAHQRKKRGRKPLPEALPRVEVIHEISVDELHCIQMDETRVQVLKEPDKKAQSKSCLWLQRKRKTTDVVDLFWVNGRSEG